jgi:hypothetical protein
MKFDLPIEAVIENGRHTAPLDSTGVVTLHSSDSHSVSRGRTEKGAGLL